MKSFIRLKIYCELVIYIQPKCFWCIKVTKMVKRLPILVTERWAEANPGVQAVSPQSSTRR